MNAHLAAARPPGEDAAHRWLVTTRRRISEGKFWIVQAGVLLVTAIHVLVEAHELIADHVGPFRSLAHLPVVLYLVPVLYAGFRYGFEGGVLTGAWAALLAVPNLFLWHSESYEWVGEAGFIAFMVGLGAVIAIPVEREQRERARADAAHHRAITLNRRLALLNDVASTLVQTVDLDETLRRVLHRLMAVMNLHTAALASWTTKPGESAPVMDACHSLDPQAHTRLSGVLAATDLASLPDQAAWLTDDILACPVLAGTYRRSALLAVPQPGQTLTRGEAELLDAVAHQIGVALDNARLHRLEKVQLHSYLQGVTRAQEEERRRIARDLHDLAIHELLVARRSLEQPTGAAPDSDPHDVTRVRDRIGQVIDHLRRFSRGLRPGVLDDLGLAPALEWLTTETDAQAGFTAIFELRGPPKRLARDVELALFRIAQEALRNVERHARARHVEVLLEFRPEGTRLSVEDDGAGFDLPAARRDQVPSGRLGLMGMHERAQLAGGALHIVSSPGRGTRVTVDLPQHAHGLPPDAATRPSPLTLEDSLPAGLREHPVRQTDHPGLI